MTLKFSSIKNDAAFTGKIRQGARVERSLSRVGAEKEKRLLLKCKVRENYDFFDYVMSVFAAHLHLVLKYDIFSWRYDFEASSYLGKFGACWNESRQEEYLEIYLSLS